MINIKTKRIKPLIKKDIIFIRGIKIKTYIGVHPTEKTHKQTVILDLEIEVNAKKAAQTDKIENTLNYQDVCNTVITFVKASKFNLIETLAEKVAALVLENFPTNHIKLHVTKPQALKPAIVGITIERTITYK